MEASQFLATIAVALLLALSTLPATAQPLVDKVCKKFQDGNDKNFCIKVLSSPKAKAAGDNPKALTLVVLKLAAADAAASGVEMTKLLKLRNLTVVRQCLKNFVSAARSFGKMIPEELEEDVSSASYDVKVNADLADECDSLMKEHSMFVPRISAGTKYLRLYALIGFNAIELYDV